MRPITCMIVDDEPLAVRLLESYVERTPELQLMASYTDSITAINAIKAQKPELLFLDIQMPNIDGMELAHILPEDTRVVFTTAFKEYAFESYDDSPLLYGNDIGRAKRILFNIYASNDHPLFVRELQEIDDFFDQLDPNIDVIWGTATDDSLGEDAKVTILATGLEDELRSEVMQDVPQVYIPRRT